MNLNRTKLYGFLFISCLAGYVWIYMQSIQKMNALNVCLFKHTTGLPCPSCGSTRSVFSIIQGNFTSALLTNPLGYIITILMIAMPLWILIDVLFKKNTLFDFYKKAEQKLKRPAYAITFISLILLNWFWNILKGI